MSFKLIYKILFVLWHVGCSVADDGEDFINNLYSDLAPLLSLFGERVTMQFMSQAIGLADCIIIAIAPLGIITIIVSAIRVRGPSLLQSIIGRARENKSSSEIELMSSTSNEVCELWNGLNVVRCQGSAKIWQFICVIPKSLEEQRDGNPKFTFAVKSLEEAERDQLIIKRSSEQVDPPRPPEDIERASSQDSAQPGSAKITVIRDLLGNAAPNLSLNCHDKENRVELWLAAILGALMQVGVLVYCGFIVYYPPLEPDFGKSGNRVAWYAFPATVGGTLTLVLGLFTCAWVIEQSTDETHYKAKENHKLFVVWIQKEGIVNDQVFNSFSVFPGNFTRHREVVTFSRRYDEPTSSTSKNNEKKESLMMKGVTTVGTGISLLGFIFQFVGFRSMNWTASLVQLGAVILMTILRAVIRRGFSYHPQSQRLTPDFELDWFALSFRNLQVAPWFRLDHKKPPSEGGTALSDGLVSWIVTTGCFGEQRYEPLNHAAQTEVPARNPMEIRRELGTLAKWQGPSFIQAVRLASAMEAVLLDFLPTPSIEGTNTFNNVWNLQIQCNEDTSCVAIHLWWESGQWKVHARDIDAILSLWLYTIKSQNQTTDDHQQLKHGDASFRAEGELVPGMRLFGRGRSSGSGWGKTRMLRDLQWWMPDGAPEVLEVMAFEEVDRNARSQKIQKDVPTPRIVGFGMGQGQAVSKESLSETQTFLCDRPRLDDEDLSGTPRLKEPVLAVECFDSLEKLYARDLFFAFMRSVVSLPGTQFKTTSKITAGHTYDETWRDLKFHNETLSKLAQKIEDTGFGSSTEVYFDLIVPLSMENRQLVPDIVIEEAETQANNYERAHDWEKVYQVCSTLLSFAAAFDPAEEYLYPRSLALCIEYLRRMDTEDKAAVSELRSRSRAQIHYTNLYSEMLEAYREGRLPMIPLVMEVAIVGDERWKLEHKPTTIEREPPPSSFKFTKMHLLAIRKDQSNDLGEVYSHDKLDALFAQDAFGRRPTHYGFHPSLNQFDSSLAKICDAKDLWGMTPLHYACLRDELETVQYLIKHGVSINAVGNNGVVPMHYAAKNGHIDIVKTLMSNANGYIPEQTQINESLGSGADVQQYRDSNQRAPIHWATIEGHGEVVELLNADVKLTDRYGWTALHLAANYGREDLVRRLCEWGANPNATTGDRRTPLHFAAEQTFPGAVHMLLNARAKVGHKDNWGSTPLHKAAFKDNSEIVHMLLEHGADIQAEDDNGWTPLHNAAAGGDLKVVRLLLEKGAKLDDPKSKAGRTPLHEAVMMGHVHIVKLFVDTDKEQCQNIAKRVRDGEDTLLHLVSVFRPKEDHGPILHELLRVIPKEMTIGFTREAILKGDIESAAAILDNVEDEMAVIVEAFPKDWDMPNIEIMNFLEGRMIKYRDVNN